MVLSILGKFNSFRCVCTKFNFIKFLGERTFGVLTKIDLMDKGTDAADVSHNNFLFVGICAVIGTIIFLPPDLHFGSP